MIHPIGLLLLALVLMGGLAAPGVAAVRADVDRKQVYIGDTVTLVIESNNPGSGEPDLSPLQQDFEILGTGTSSRFSMINGRSSGQRSWRVQLRPRRMGSLQIPVLRLGNEQTEALTISVSDIPALATTSGDAPALVETSIDVTGTVYVQQQIPLTVRLYQDQRVVDGTLDALQVSDALIEPLGLERRYTANRNGRQYRVSERRYAVAAERRGLLEIPALDFRGKLAPPPSSAGSVQPFRVSSEPLAIDVQPPATNGDYWLPAQQLNVDDSWSANAPTLRRGEPVDRVITLQATGLNGTQLPILQLTPPSGARIYPGRQMNDTRSDSNALYGISRQTFTYVPGEEGQLSIPSFTVDWWNTTTQQEESAAVDALTLQVMPGAAGRGTADRSLSGEHFEGDVSVDGDGGAMPWWLWLLVGFGLLFALFRLRYRLIDRAATLIQLIPVPRRAGGRTDPQQPLPVENRPAATDPTRPSAPAFAPSTHRSNVDVVGNPMGQLESACQRHDAQAAALALLALGRARWPDAPPTNLHDLAERLPRGQAEIEALDRVLYGGARQTWDGAALWADIASIKWQEGRAVTKDSNGSSIPPLYPHQV